MDNVEDDGNVDADMDAGIKLAASKDKGLADVEVGSACYMSEMLNFNLDEYEECDQTPEDDLLLLNDPFVKSELKARFAQCVT